MSNGYDLIVNGNSVHVQGDGTKPLLSVSRSRCSRVNEALTAARLLLDLGFLGVDFVSHIDGARHR